MLQTIVLACVFVAVLLVVAVYIALIQIKLKTFQEQLLNLPLQISKLKEDAVIKVLASESYVRTYSLVLDVDVMRRIAADNDLKNALVAAVDRSTVGMFLTFQNGQLSSSKVVKAESVSKAFAREAVEFLIFKRSSFSSSVASSLQDLTESRRVHTLLIGNTPYRLLGFFSDLSMLKPARGSLPLADVHIVPVVPHAMSSFYFTSDEERAFYKLPSSALASAAASSYSTFASLADLVKSAPKSAGSTMLISALGGAF